ncbi:MAG: DUF4192 family protein [Actinobacteria bacterium]|nr:DUF4192 family protein [Actinomycetota bacterium]
MDQATHAHSRRIQIARETLVDLVKSFGFYPADSVIINWMKAAESVLAQRVDVEVFLEPTDLSKSDLELFIEPGRIYQAEQARVLTCLTYMDERIYSGIDAVQEALAKYEIEVKDVFVFAGDRVFSRECDEGCEPHLMHVEKKISRVSWESQCDSDSSVFIDAQAFPVVPSVEDLSPWRTTESAFVQHLLGQWCANTATVDIARMVVALEDIRVRDSILWDLANGAYEQVSVAESMSKLLPRLDANHGAAIATTAAICWWLHGNGAMANICIARALSDSPHYSLAQMIRSVLDYALPPEFWLASVNGLTRHECLTGVDVTS